MWIHALFEQDYDVDDLRSRHAIAGDEKILLYVGKVMSPKGAFDCLEMLARLRRSGRQVRMIMIGDIHDRERESSRPASAPSISTPPSCPSARSTIGARSRGTTNSSDVVLFPSQYEQFGIVALEAAASGRPLLGTPVGIMQTLVPRYEFGLLHSFGDIDALHAQRERRARRAVLPGQRHATPARNPFAVRLARRSPRTPSGFTNRP